MGGLHLCLDIHSAMSFPRLFRYLILTVLLASMVEGNCGSDFQHNKTSNLISLNKTYCYVNNCTVKLKESNLLLNITNETGEWIVVANTTNLFIISADNTLHNSSCSPLEDQPRIGFFIFISIIAFVTIVSSSISIVLHLVIKELRTILGQIVIEICVTVIISGICQVAVASLQHAYKVNEDKVICAVAKYSIAASTLFYTITKAIYLFHFACLMYRTFRLQTNSRSHGDKKLFCIYNIIVIIVGTICTVLVILSDFLSHEKSAFNIQNGYCTSSFHDVHTSTSNRLLLIFYSLVAVIQIILFILALTFYCVATKQSRMYVMIGQNHDRPSSIRVSVTLIFSVALGAFLLVVLLLAGVGGESSVISAGIAVLIEQTVLLIVFASSRKVRAKWNHHGENDSGALQTALLHGAR